MITTLAVFALSLGWFVALWLLIYVLDVQPTIRNFNSLLREAYLEADKWESIAHGLANPENLPEWERAMEAYEKAVGK